MKIRIQGNSVRFRLSKSEVEQLGIKGFVEEKTNFPQGKFSYSVRQDADNSMLSASFEQGSITLHVPSTFASGWAGNNIVGLDTSVPMGDQSLYLLLEKDFKCLDHASEDQSDNYENPSKTC
jgi:hypothetical protein